MLPLRTRRRVQRLLERHSAQRVSDMTGVSLSSVKRIGAEPPVRGTDDEAERKRRAIGRPSKVERYRRVVEHILDRNPDRPTVEILGRLRKAGFRGGRTAVYRFVAELRG